jgi:hypothetical protein
MVFLPLYQKMQQHYKKNLRNYVLNHPGEYVLFESDEFSNLNESFFESERALKKATRKYEVFFGPTFFAQRIPERLSSEVHAYLDFLDGIRDLE